jgi:hypothetical protein
MQPRHGVVFDAPDARANFDPIEWGAKLVSINPIRVSGSPLFA